MAYTRTTWQDYPNTTTAITAARLNNIEQGVVNANAVTDVITSGAWTSYTPTVGSGTITVGTGGSNSAKYAKYGRTVMVQGLVSLGTGGSMSAGPINLSLPFAAATGVGGLGVSEGYDASAATFAIGVVELQPGAQVVNFRFTIAGGSIQGLGGTNPWTWAASDALSWMITYEAAS